MKFTFSPTSKLAHHSLKAAWPLLAVGFAIPAYHGPIALRISSYLIYLAGALAFLASITHTARATVCTHCTQRPAHQLRRLHNRAWAACGRYGWIAVSAALLVWLNAAAFVDPITVKDSASSRISVILLITIASLYVAARTFNDTHYGLPRPRPFSQYLDKNTSLPHRARKLIVPATIINAAVLIMPTRGPWSLFGNAIIALVITSYVLFLRHSARLCEDCVIEFRIDAPEHAAKHPRRFAIAHKQTIFLMPTLAASVGSSFLPHLWVMGLAITGALSCALAVAAASFHTSFQPWCPYCRGGDGHGGHHAPDPDPAQGQPIPA